jgi:hypothetical protein
LQYASPLLLGGFTICDGMSLLSQRRKGEGRLVCAWDITIKVIFIENARAEAPTETTKEKDQCIRSGSENM